MNTRRWLPWAGGASVVALLVWQAWPEAGKKAGGRAADAGAGSASAPLSARAASRAANVSEELSYDLELESRVSSQQQTLIQFNLTGVWQVTELGQLASGTSFRVALLQPHVTSVLDDEEAAARLADFAKGLDSAFFISKDAAGAVSEARLASNVPLPAQTLLKSVVAFSQVVAADPRQQSWQTLEVDTTGRYQAAYRQLSENRYEKRKLSYTEILGAAAGAQVQGQTNRVESSKAELVVDAAGNLISLDLNETLVGSGGVMPDLTSVTHLRLKQKQRVKAQLDIQSATRDFEAFAPGPLFERKRSGARQPELDRARVGGQTFPQLMGKLRGLGAPSEQNRTERARTFVELSALLRQEPDAAALALRAIRQGTEADYMVEALGNAGTPEAQAALAELIGDSATAADLRSRAVATLGNTAATDDTISLLASLSTQPDVGATAKLALGGAVYNLQSTNPASAERGTRELLTMLARDAGQGGMHNDLRALGNAGSPLALPAISQVLASNDAQLRLSAVYALRRIPGPEVDALLASISLEDPSSLVRRAAVASMRGRPASQTLLSSLVQSVKLETDYDTRLGAINALADWSKTQPEAVSALAWAAQNDEDEKLRAIAQLAMGSG
jgi:HEAT repeat protein